jgi:hypothetical protein
MKVSVIIQGEGKGHFSQAMEAIHLLGEQGDEIAGCYLGRSLFRSMPTYFREASPLPLRTFLGPNFLRTPDRKGIHIFFSLVLNAVLAPVYLFETIRLGCMLRRDGSRRVLNFYDPVGALACRWMKRKTRKTVISHHFYLSHPDFIHPHGLERAYFWLQLMNTVMMRLADEVFALSFRKGATHGRIRVVPPLVAGELGNDQGHATTGRGPDLCYFLNPGFAEEMVNYYGDRPGLEADLFTEGPLKSEPPVNVRIHSPDRKKFLAAMKHAGRVICTAGFDTVAEAFRLGIPVFVIPSENHYEQYCNALDAVRTGMAYQLDSLAELDDAVFEPKGNAKYLKWLETGHDEIFRRT